MGDRRLHREAGADHEPSESLAMEKVRMQCQVTLVGESLRRRFLKQIGQPLSAEDQKYIHGNCDGVVIGGKPFVLDPVQFVKNEVDAIAENNRAMEEIYRRHPELKRPQN